jgi:hypothetical protein
MGLSQLGRIGALRGWPNEVGPSIRLANMPRATLVMLLTSRQVIFSAWKERTANLRDWGQEIAWLHVGLTPNQNGQFRGYLVLFWRIEVAVYLDCRDLKQAEDMMATVEESAELLNE